MKIDKALVASVLMVPDLESTGVLIVRDKKTHEKKVFIAYGEIMFDASSDAYVKSASTRRYE